LRGNKTSPPGQGLLCSLRKTKHTEDKSRKRGRPETLEGREKGGTVPQKSPVREQQKSK